MTSWIPVILAVLGIISMILKDAFSDETRTAADQKRIEDKEVPESQNLDEEVSQSAIQTQGLANAWDKADAEG